MALYVMIAAGTAALAALVQTVPAGGGTEYRLSRGSRRQVRNGLCLVTIFIVLFALAACRMNVGNDYAKYVEFMHLIACGAYEYVPTEAGFNLLVAVRGREFPACFRRIRFFYPLAFFENDV